jgi:thioredoxin 1
MSVLKITDSSFKTDVTDAKGKVLVDFWAEWCGPCRMLSPILEELAAEVDETTIAKLNIDENPETAAILGVRSIPTLMIFKNGQMVGTKVGVQSKASLLEWIESV